MSELERELEEALRGVESEAAKKPCGCGGAETGELSDIFGAEEFAAGGELAIQLDAALSAALTEGADPFAAQELSADEALAFADVETGPQLSLGDLLYLVEQYPGLKITFSY